MAEIERAEFVLVSLIDVLAGSLLRNNAVRHGVSPRQMAGIAETLADVRERVWQAGTIGHLREGRRRVEGQRYVVLGTEEVAEIAEVGLGFAMIVSRLIVWLWRLERVVGSSGVQVHEVAELARLSGNGVLLADGRSAL